LGLDRRSVAYRNDLSFFPILLILDKPLGNFRFRGLDPFEN
jgi:hypothetical protein